MIFDTKKLSKKKAAAGAGLVMLSGFVPQIPTPVAYAASASLSVTGSFITGIEIAVGGNIKIGKIAATDSNGSLTVNVLGVVNPSKAVTAGGAPQNGSFNLTFVDTGPDVDISVSNLGTVALGPSVGGVPATGTVKINKIILDNFATAAVSLTDNGVGFDSSKNVDITVLTGTMNLGVQLTWGSPQPIGSFTHVLQLTVSY